MNKKREQKDVSSIFFTNIHEFAQTTKQMFSLNSYSELNAFIILQLYLVYVNNANVCVDFLIHKLKFLI